MKRKLIGLLASAALIGAPAVAFAQDQGTGGAGQAQQQQATQGMQQQQGANEITGKVIKTEKDTVYLEAENGAVVPLQVNDQTQFTDPNVKSASDLQQGQDVRASFTIEDQTKNLATSISSGAEMQPGQQQPGAQPEQQGQQGQEQQGSGY